MKVGDELLLVISVYSKTCIFNWRNQAITRFDLEVISSAIPATGFDLDASVRVRAPRQELLRANGLDAQRHSYPEMWDRER